MADKRISQLIERVDIANNDVLPIVASGATTTNKVTISTLQDWMQDNLDVGITSVGITLGTSGTDVNVTGSPITTSGNITINIPDASASNRGVVTTGSQTFGGVKTFANGLILPSAGGTNQFTRFLNIGTIHQGSAGSNQIGFNNSNNIYFGKGLSNGGVIQWTNAAVRYYTLPDADGTIALTSQLDGYVTLGTAQTITAQKTFTTSGGDDTLIVDHTSGSGIALDISKGGNGEGLRVTKTSGSGNAVSITGGNFSAEAATFSGVVTTTPDAVINGVNVGKGGGSISSNTRVGVNSIQLNTTGIANTGIGNFSLQNNTTGSGNTAIGSASMQLNTTGGSNTAIGFVALTNNTTGNANTATGAYALENNTTGSNNTAFGQNALENNIVGAFNTAVGFQSLQSNTNSSNTAIGHLASSQNSSGTANFSGGARALENNTTGSVNTSIGFASLQTNTTGGGNVAIGEDAGRYISTGTGNTNGGNSVFIGRQTKPLGDSQGNQIVIGYQAIGNGSNTVTLGNDSITNTYLKGAVTLTGALNGTSASFSGNVTVDKSSPTLQLNAPTGTAGEYRLSNSVGTTHWSMFTVIGGSNSQGNFGLYSLGKTGGAGSVLDITPTGAATFSSTLACSGAFIQLNQTEIFSSAGASNRAYAFGLGNTAAGDFVIMQGSTATGGTYTPRLAISPTGNVGIGTASPSVTNYGIEFTVSGINKAAQPEGIINIQGNRTSDLNIGGINFYNSSNFIAQIVAARSGANNSGDLRFTTVNSGTAGERMRITSGGGVGIGTNSVTGTTKLRAISIGAVQGDPLFFSDNGVHNAIGLYSAGADGYNGAVTVMIMGRNTTNSRSINAGGTINASGTDYAEYMTKAVDENISKGDIVGINLDGKLTNIFDDSISFVVKSTDPSYVGGDTWGNVDDIGKLELDATDEQKAKHEAKIEAARAKVDRIAFSGQVPCNVLGASVGDYIIPIKNEEGKISGQAVTKPTLEQYQISVGKIWKIMEDGRAWIAVKIG